MESMLFEGERMRNSLLGVALLLLPAAFAVPCAYAAQSAGVTGRWLATGVPYEPWTLDLRQDGTNLTGTVQQNGALRGPVPIYDGTVNGAAISFKAKSPDNGARTITFTGSVNGDVMTLNRSAEATPGAGVGAGMTGTGVFGGSGTGPFTAKRDGSATPATPPITG